jgi:predicted Zn finger-like uncharacterized protein
MRMVCPACSAAYEVPDSLLTPGRSVRCARCGHQWAPVELEPPPREPPAAPGWPDAELIEDVEAEPLGRAPLQTPSFTAMDRLALHRASTGGSPVALRIAWVASLLALLLLAAAGYVWRAEIMHVWPASQRLYHALGVTQNTSAKP